MPDGDGDVTATFLGETVTAAIDTKVNDQVTHIGIQIRKASNTDIPSPTIDNLSSSHP